MFEFKPRVLLRSKHRVEKNADFSRTRHNVQISSTYPRHSSTNWNQISRQFSLRINHLLLEKGFYPEQLLLFCVVLLKWAFCSTFCVFWSHFRMLAVSFEIFCHRYLLQSKDGKKYLLWSSQLNFWTSIWANQELKKTRKHSVYMIKQF